MAGSKACLLSWVALLLLLANPAHAYIDPTTGSMVLQLVLGGLAGLGIALRVMWRRITAPRRRDQVPSEEDVRRDGPEAPRGV
jgi:hypothetical protein